MEYAHRRYLGRQWGGSVSCCEIASTTGIWKEMKVCVAAWFLSSSSSQSWKTGKHRLKGQAERAHQWSNNTADDRPRGEPGLPAHHPAWAAREQLQQWKIIQTWVLSSGQGQRLSRLETAHADPFLEEWKGTRVGVDAETADHLITLVQCLLGRNQAIKSSILQSDVSVVYLRGGKLSWL